MLTYNLGELFESVVDAVGEREAVVCGGRRLTYRQLDERVNRLAHALDARGLGPGDHLALVLRNGNEYLEAMLAAFKLRAVPINVNTRYTVDELRYLLQDAAPAVVLHEPDLADAVTVALTAPEQSGRSRADPLRAEEDPARNPAADRPVRISRGPELEAMLDAASPRRPRVEGRSGDDLYILYTGGTTGAPKGVIWRQEDLLFAALAGGNLGGEPVTSPDEVAACARRGRTRILPASPFTHGTAHWTALATLLNGGAVVIDPASAFDATALWDIAEQEAVTTLVIVGDAFARPLAAALDEEPDRWSLDDLLIILSGGAVLSPATREQILDHLPWIVVVDGYGTSETGGQGSMPLWAGQRAATLPRFHVDEHTTVLDDAGRPAPPGSGLVGRLARRGRIPLGYHGDPDKSARTFIEASGSRWAVPGDLAKVEADGTITLLGRGSSSINSGGEKVFPEEVELVLKAEPSVFDAVVVGIPDSRFGERVAAVIELRPGVDFGRERIDDHCRAHLAAYKVPRVYAVVDQLRRRPTGKADLRWARDLLSSPDAERA